jgi:uncharacterized membrane protein YiaA
MSPSIRNVAAPRKGRKLIWILTIILVTVGLLAAARRTYVLLAPPQEPRFAAAAAMDSGFAQHKALTFTHILPAALFMVLMPLQFIRRIRERRLAWHRWSGRLLIILGFVVGMFFAAQKLSAHEFFGIAFWLGFTLTLLGAEAWIQHARPQSTALPGDTWKPNRR